MKARIVWRRSAGQDAAEMTLIQFDGRTLAVFGAALPGPFLAENGNAQIPDFIVDLAEGGFGKFMSRREFFLEACDAGERAIDLAAGQSTKDAMDVLDLGNAMTNHREVVPGRNRETDRVLESKTIENRAHVEIVGHDETLKADVFAEQFGNNASR